MFHVEQIFALFGVASACLGATPAPSEQAPPAPSTHTFTLPLASDNESSVAETALGMQALLFGDEAEARQHFTAAVAEDASSPLPSVGLALLSRNATERAELLKKLSEDFQNVTTTPVETFYVTTFLKMLEGKTAEAARDFSERADRFAGDLLSSCWATLLLHYSNTCYDSEGNMNAEHALALRRAEELYKNQGNDFAPACYLRALVEESAPEVSAQALEASAALSKLTPDSAAAQNLHAYLLYRSGRAEEAAKFFNLAYKTAQAQGNDMLALRARHFESVALWTCKKDMDALRIRRELNALKHDASATDERNIFLSWEIRTLPLRILVQRETLPHPGDISAAVLTAVPTSADKNAPFAKAINSIADTLSARIAFCAGKRTQAILLLKKAENGLKVFEEAQNICTAPSLSLITPYKRLHAACVISLNKAKAEIYSSTAETWNDNVRRATLQTPPDSTRPPVIPSR